MSDGESGEKVMKLLFKQRLFSWFDSYDIYDEAGNTVYVVKGQLSWGHKLVIYDAYGNEAGMVVQKVFTFLPKFEIYKNGSYIGCLSKEFSFLTPQYNIDYNGYRLLKKALWMNSLKKKDVLLKTVQNLLKLVFYRNFH